MELDLKLVSYTKFLSKFKVKNRSKDELFIVQLSYKYFSSYDKRFGQKNGHKLFIQTKMVIIAFISFCIYNKTQIKFMIQDEMLKAIKTR